MKSNFYLKLFLIIFLCTSFLTVECIHEERVKRILHNSHKHKAEKAKATFQAKYATFLNIADKFLQRDKIISMFSDVRELINIAWQLLVVDGTDFKEVDKQLKKINDAYDIHFSKKDVKNNQVKKQEIQAEKTVFLTKFNNARQQDEKNELYLTERAQIENQIDTTEKNTTISQSDKNNILEVLKVKLRELNQKILIGQSKIHLILTDFLNPQEDFAKFKKHVVKAIESSMPDKFCYRQLLKINTDLTCPASHPDHQMALCYETCKQGQERLGKDMKKDQKDKFMVKNFTFFYGVCWERCNKEKKPECEEFLLNIYPNGRSWSLRNLFGNSHVRESFIPQSNTHFSEQVTCPAGQVKRGALCYTQPKTCEQYGYQGCGVAACALSQHDCAEVIKDMTVSTLTGLAQFSLMFVAPGAANIIKVTASVISAINAMSTIALTMQRQREALEYVNSSQILKNRMIKDIADLLENKKQNFMGPQKIERQDLIKNITEIFDQQIQIIQSERNEQQQQTTSQRITNNIVGSEDRADKADQALEIYQIGKDLHDTSVEITKAVYQSVEATATSPSQALSDGVTESSTRVIDFARSGNDALRIFDSVVFDLRLAKSASDLVKDCKDDYESIECVKGFIGVAAVFDPTGLLGIAKAFMYNTCQDP